MPGSPRKNKSHRYSLDDFNREFPDDAACLDFLWRQLYSDDGAHATCPKCERTRGFHRVKSRKSYSCDTCGHHLHPTAGTIFHKSTTPLRMWFHAVFIMSATRCGISAKQLEREIGVTYKTAWRMFNRIRKLLAEENAPLGGEVEIDETFIGGKLRNRHRSVDPRRGTLPGRAKPGDPWVTPVLGMVQRGGGIVARVVPDTAGRTLLPHIRARPAGDDDLHRRVASVRQAAWARLPASAHPAQAGHLRRRSRAHTNTIEGFWSLVKRGISGTYHSVSRKWLQDYLNEYSFRYNHRDDHESMFKLLLRNVREDRAAYEPAFPPRRPELAS